MLKIVKDNQKSIRERCVDVEMPISKEIKQTLDEMLDYLKLSQDATYRETHKNVREGVGLAAPQIGLNIRMLVVYIPKAEGEVTQYQLVNPRIVSNSVRKAYLSCGEGCLSVDNDHEGYVYRSYKIQVKAFDALVNKDVTIVARGYEAIVLQHEIDHLNGILYYDHINKSNPFEEIPDAVAL